VLGATRAVTRLAGGTCLCRATAVETRQDGWRGKVLLRQQSADPDNATSALCRATMYNAAWVFGHVRAIGAAKSVSFKKKPTMLDLKFVFKKC